MQLWGVAIGIWHFKWLCNTRCLYLGPYHAENVPRSELSVQPGCLLHGAVQTMENQMACLRMCDGTWDCAWWHSMCPCLMAFLLGCAGDCDCWPNMLYMCGSMSCKGTGSFGSPACCLWTCQNLMSSWPLSAQATLLFSVFLQRSTLPCCTRKHCMQGLVLTTAAWKLCERNHCNWIQVSGISVECTLNSMSVVNMCSHLQAWALKIGCFDRFHPR